MKHSKSSLFLMELVIVILFFSLSSAVCIQLFVKAHNIDRETVEMNHSILWIQNIAESFRGCHGDITAVKELFQTEDVATSASELILLFDDTWQPTVDRDTSVYRVYMKAYSNADPSYPRVKAANDPSRMYGKIYSADIYIEKLINNSGILQSQHIDHYNSRKGVY